ncbi:acylneuraminate cytidylyltransferase family protein [Flavobacterium johnsoniae]|jgi:N-acylneuraminate cytidylyltransferase|uniref:Acylneuraminate cytidylyltransferase n=1 Tax=Flavobacterium johnsoniae (strain ATCC 17061 / DSM 2064 / JCM 8514 / BCRC 14874 / CCUG 350202 / NBRC 14942 / NCIMB 11054 / UW101) TaxID=376686 RepID=A5FN76_FLAJ1|nr:acylneuraminate cytidylyltransferase family protein [Flavobacterium johnsoniae]ABQ03343.1 acylneuraminate cytidylyltransferase [Flavobacterium johnsoniae UW101]OXG01240.1 acylneuraminate cytidylyltransferase [Flavobacterium johnsoniae UW101]WQG79792.1 acylneuraminate cytidylyltransferase family protein [Flavobacterium johnsoniae UW101]SHL77999.1 N-acylneuraminate cytidylyltransferase [Flavobacterium johnsoniae]
MKTIAIIPARGGSKRLPDKNILLFGGIPLIAHSILYAKANAVIDEVYVSTNSEPIKEIALKFGAKVIDRPENISGDLEPTVSALKHVLETIEMNVENIILLQPTNPLRPDNLLNDAFNIYQKESYNSLFTVSRNHQKFGKIKDSKFIPFNYEIGQRSQDLEPLFFENGLLYITKSKLIFENIIISEDAFPFEVNHIFAATDIDTQEDFDYAQYLYLLSDKK